MGPLRPALAVRLLDAQGRRIEQTRGLIDSGADRTTLSNEWAALLGIDLATECHQEEVTLSDGTASQRDVYTGGLHIEVAGLVLMLDVVQFCPKPPCAILGRRDLFDRHLVLIDQRSRRFYLERLPDPEEDEDDDPDLALAAN